MIHDISSLIFVLGAAAVVVLGLTRIPGRIRRDGWLVIGFDVSTIFQWVLLFGVVRQSYAEELTHPLAVQSFHLEAATILLNLVFVILQRKREKAQGGHSDLMTRAAALALAASVVMLLCIPKAMI